MSIYGCQRLLYNLNVNKNFKFYWKSVPSERTFKNSISLLSGAVMLSSLLLAPGGRTLARRASHPVGRV